MSIPLPWQDYQVCVYRSWHLVVRCFYLALLQAMLQILVLKALIALVVSTYSLGLIGPGHTLCCSFLTAVTKIPKGSDTAKQLDIFSGRPMDVKLHAINVACRS